MDTETSTTYGKESVKLKKRSLFQEAEEAYLAFRQTIIDAPPCTYEKNKLPFEGVRELLEKKPEPMPEQEIPITLQKEEKPHADISKYLDLSIIHCFLKDGRKEKEYRAEGDYFVREKTINVLAGAEFAIHVSPDVEYSLADYQRKTVINLFCSTKKSKYTLKKDCFFDSVDEAAFCVTGNLVDGLTEWTTEDGFSLGEIVEKIAENDYDFNI